jgi:Subtilase family
VNTTSGHPLRPRRAVVAAAIALGTVAAVLPVAMAASPATAAPPPACGPLGKLYTYDLNDRCDFGTQLDPEKVEADGVVAGLRLAGLFSTTVECADGSFAPVVAAPDELLVTAPNRGQLDEALGRIRVLLGPVFLRVQKINALGALVALRPGTVDDAFLARTVPTLQGTTWSADLNYLEPALPNNGFRPDDNPLEAAPALSGNGGKGSVLVLDSPAELLRYPRAPDVVVSTAGPLAVYDVDLNDRIDEDHGHGVFVASIIKRLAPSAEVMLYGVNGGHVPGSGRWSPMLFSDADLIASMGAAFGLSWWGTTTRRTFDVVNLSLGGASCDGVAARLGLGRFMRDLAVAAGTRGVGPTYVAAAGNDGADVAHLPAAFRDKHTMEAAARAVDAAVGLSPSPEGNAVRQLHADLADATIAVGSWTGGVRDAFSNCGEWVDATASGASTVSRYPSKSEWASWSGTSFATPQVAAALVGAAPPGVTIADGSGVC